MQAYETQLDAFGDQTRRVILDRLRNGPQPVGELARGFSISRPAISQHLRILKQARLVKDEAVGTRRIYHLDPRGFASLRAYLDSFWDIALNEFKLKAEEK